MGTITLQIPQVGVDLNSVADPKVAGNFNVLQTLVNGNIDLTNLSPALQAQLVGVPPGQITGHTNIAASESRTNTAFGTLTTPDQVGGIVLPANGLITVWYQATWQESVNGAAAAAIFVGANQLVFAALSGAPALGAASIGGGFTGKNTPLSTWPSGLTSPGDTAVQYSGDVTTGQAVAATAGGVGAATGGPCYIFAAAGTYTISVQFKAVSGSVTASNRKLWVQALTFS